MGRRGGRRGGGGGGGGGPPIDRPRGGRSSTFVRPVGELARIDILNALEAFRADPEETELIFPPDVDNHFRAVVHAESRKLGLTSKSHGKGAERRVHVRKVGGV